MILAMSLHTRAAFTASVLVRTSLRTLKLNAPSQANKTIGEMKNVLKLDAFDKRRKIALEKVKHEKDQIIMKIAEELETGQTANSRDIKELLFIAESEDLPLVIAAMKKFVNHTTKVRFSEFNFDVGLMRLLYVLNEAKLAADTFMDPAFKNGLTAYTSVLILLQLLYNNSMYSEILDCVDLLENKQSYNVWSSRTVSLFYSLSCLQINTPEVRKKAILHIEKYVSYRKPYFGPALVAAYCALHADPSKTAYFTELVNTAYFEVKFMKFNILLQLLLKEGKLVSVLDLLENCPDALTQDTVDLILKAVGKKAELDLKCFIADHIEVKPATLRDFLIDYCTREGIEENEIEGEEN